MANSGGDKKWDIPEEQYFVDNVLPRLMPGMKAEDMVQFGFTMQNMMAMIYPVKQHVYTGDCMYQYWRRKHGPHAKERGEDEWEVRPTLAEFLGPLGLPLSTLLAPQQQIRDINVAQTQSNISNDYTRLRPLPIMKQPIPCTPENPADAESDDELSTREDTDTLTKGPENKEKGPFKNLDYNGDYNPFTGATLAGSPLPMSLRKRRNLLSRRLPGRIRRNSVSQYLRR